jgi:type III secretion protein R
VRGAPVKPRRRERRRRGWRFLALLLLGGLLVTWLPGELFAQAEEPAPRGGAGAGEGLGIQDRAEEPLQQREPREEEGAEAEEGEEQPRTLSRPIVMVLVLSALSLLPFALVMVTSFVKLSVVGSIIRSALGTQQIPPTQVVTGLALILTIHIMLPVGLDVYDRIRDSLEMEQGQPLLSNASIENLAKAMRQGKEPVKAFLLKHSHEKDVRLFQKLALELRRAQKRGDEPDAHDFSIIVPAFVISELKEAFTIGFILFVPFVVIDMVVSNILLAMGMFMLSPVTVSLPLKLLLFVLVDGWSLITQGLVRGYAVPG